MGELQFHSKQSEKPAFDSSRCDAVLVFFNVLTVKRGSITGMTCLERRYWVGMVLSRIVASFCVAVTSAKERRYTDKRASSILKDGARSLPNESGKLILFLCCNSLPLQSRRRYSCVKAAQNSASSFFHNDVQKLTKPQI